MTKKDAAITLLICARDQFFSGNFMSVIKNINAALELLEKDDPQAVDNAVLNYFEGEK